MASFKKSLIFLLQAVIAGLAIAFVVVWFRPQLLEPPPVSSPAAGTQAASYADAVTATAPAVVNIYTNRRSNAESLALGPETSVSEYLQNFLPGRRRRPEANLGSGVLIGDGYVLTNHHVVEDSETTYVALADGRVTNAMLVGSDPDTDLALLAIDLRDLPAIRMGRSDTLRIGDVVLAIGNPFGIGQTVTQGIVSATGRSRLGLSIFENYIQTDASINPGNSGGALVNTLGELVGINTAMFSRNDGSEGIGFAIPVNLVRGVMQQLIEHGRVIRGWLGVNAQTVTPALVRSLGLSESSGILLSGVFPYGPASQAGLRAGDVIHEINQQEVTSWEQALNEIARLAPGSPVQVHASRNGQHFEVEARVTERPPLPRRGS